MSAEPLQGMTATSAATHLVYVFLSVQVPAPAAGSSIEAECPPINPPLQSTGLPPAMPPPTVRADPPLQVLTSLRQE